MAMKTNASEDSTPGEVILFGWIESYREGVVSFFIITSPSGDKYHLLPQKQDLLNADSEHIEVLFEAVQILAEDIGLSVSRKAFDRCLEEILVMARSRKQLDAIMKDVSKRFLAH